MSKLPKKLLAEARARLSANAIADVHARAEQWLFERNAALTRAELAEERCAKLQQELERLRKHIPDVTKILP
jgi:hypothetical protein